MTRRPIRMLGFTAGLLASAGLAWVSPAAAQSALDPDIAVRFTEAAPKDNFTITNRARCDLAIETLTIDLDGSAGDLIFDTTAGGEGSSVYQPFELVAGGDKVRAVTEVTDGGRAVTFEFTGLESGEYAMFTIDVDDRVAEGPMGPTMVAGSEIAGARLTAVLVGPTGARQTIEARFEGTTAGVLLGHCAVS